MNAQSGAVIYLTKYVEPGVQEPAQVYYNIPANILTVLTANPNIVDKVVDSGISRDIIEREFNNIASDKSSTLGSGRTSYQAKLDQAKTYFSTKAQEQPTDGSTNTTSSGGTTNSNTGDIPTEKSTNANNSGTTAGTGKK
jgi:hypothetical protein